MSKTKCVVCTRDPKRMNGEFSECGHLDCPHRRRAWSERPAPQYKGPWTKNEDKDPDPLDSVIKD